MNTGKMTLDLKTLKLIIKMGRYQFMIIGILLYLIGAFWAMITADADPPAMQLILGLVVMSPGHISVSYSNDYFDIEADRIKRKTSYSGGSGVLIEHPELRPVAKWIALIYMSWSVLTGIAFTLIFSLPLWLMIFIVAGNLLAWFYTAPPLRLAYRGFGEICNSIAIGFFLPGMGFLVAKEGFSPEFLYISIPLSILGFLFVFSVNMPDREGDIAAGKKNMIVLLGRKNGFLIIGFFAFFLTAYFLALYITGWNYSVDGRILGGMSLIPLILASIGVVKHPKDREKAIKVAVPLVSSVFLFVLLMLGYLVFLLVF